MSTRYNPSIVRDTLVLYIDAANTKSYPGSGTTWTDISGQSNNGTLTNGPTFNSSNGGSILFDGSNDSISISNSSSLNTTPTVTISSWINPSGFGGGNFGRIIDSQDSYKFFLDNTVTYGTLGVRYWPSTGAALSVSNVVTLNEWANFTVVHSGSNVVIYKNGISIGTSGSFSTLPSTSSTILIGNRDDNARGFEGKMSQVFIYNRALTATEVQQNYHAHKGRYGI